MSDTQLTVMAGLPAGGVPDATTAALNQAFEFLGSTTSVALLVERALDQIPDVILLHESLGGVSGFADVARELRERVPASRVVLLSSATDPAALEAVRAGVSCVLPAKASPAVVVETVRACARGESVISAPVAAGILHEMTGWVTADPDPVLRKPTLTRTEAEVLARLADGLAPAEIADQHHVTQRLVNLHVGYAVAKLQLHLARERKLVIR